MKKLFIISALLLVGALSVSAQTYCYKYVYAVSSDGVKSNRASSEGFYRYVTFTNNMNICYLSDKDGFKNGNKMVYTKNDNGVIQYESETIKFPTMSVRTGEVFKFSSDLSRMNYRNPFNPSDREWEVYERVAAPTEEKAPTQLY